MRAYAFTLFVVTGCTAAPKNPTVERAEELIASAPVRRGAVELHCDPPDAQVEVDGVPQGVCTDFAGAPNGLTLGDGLHRIDVKKSGFRPYQTYYQASGARAVLRIALQPSGKGQGAGR